MARTKGPLFSLEASGTVGNVITYSQWKGRNYVRRHVVPQNPQTAEQVNVRKAMALCVEYWQTIGGEVQPTFNAFAKSTGMSGFNQFVKRAMKEYDIQLGTDVDPLSITLVGQPPNETWTWAPVV